MARLRLRGHPPLQRWSACLGSTAPGRVSPRAMYFLDRREGWLVGDKGAILHTWDGGRHWRVQASNVDESLAGIHCSDRSHCYAIGECGTVVSTRDGGTHWSELSIPHRE